ncbi:hypothetical protein [Polaromonas sp. P5_D5]
MSFIKILIVLGLAGFGYQYWTKHREGQPVVASTGSAGSSGSNGFVALPGTSSTASNAVQVIAAEDCPEEAAQRANSLAEQLSGKGIPVTRTHSISFTVTSGDAADAQRISSIMSGELPIVLVRGKAKSNPSLDEVVAEYRGR